MLSAVHILDVNIRDSISCEVSTNSYGAMIPSINSIVCKVKKGHPKPSISWTRKGMDSVIAEGPTLEFEDPLPEHQGTYFVQV